MTQRTGEGDILQKQAGIFSGVKKLRQVIGDYVLWGDILTRGELKLGVEPGIFCLSAFTRENRISYHIIFFDGSRYRSSGFSRAIILMMKLVSLRNLRVPGGIYPDPKSLA